MVIEAFPPIEAAEEDGLIGVGGDLEVESLILAYSSGIFPWPPNDDLLLWFCPPQRAVLFFDELHISRSLQKAARKNNLRIEFNKNFKEVIKNCAKLTNRGSQKGTWITDEIKSAYFNLHTAGFAESAEAYDASGNLVAGIYGVRLGKMFAAESSFYRIENASKILFLALVDKLKSEGLAWLDCQQLTPFSKGFGAREISRDAFLQLLEKALQS